MDQQTAMTAIQWITFLVYLLAIGSVLFYEARRKTSFSGFPFLVVGIHGALFYLFLYMKFQFGWLPPWYEWMNFTVWSSVLRMHCAMTIAAVFAFEAHEQVRIAKLSRRVKRHALE